MIHSNTQNSNIYNHFTPRTAGTMPVFNSKRTAAASEIKHIQKAISPLKPDDFAPQAANHADMSTKNIQNAKKAPPTEEPNSFFSFLKSVVDIINPLQHIPVIGAIYRELTGDEISPSAKIVGGTLYGGPIGSAVALADVAYKKTTGDDFGEKVIASLTNKENQRLKEESPIQIAQASTREIDPNDIIWYTPAPMNTHNNIASKAFNSPLSPAPTQSSGEKGEEQPVSTAPTPHTLVSKLKDKDSVSLRLTASKTDSTTVLQSSKASAVASLDDTSPVPMINENENERIVLPKDMIAFKMMEALDKYKEMKIADFNKQPLHSF